MTAAAPVSAQSDEGIVREVMALPWLDSGSGDISGVASIAATPEARFIGGDSAARFIELSGNPPRPDASIVAPNDLRWFSVYQYDDVGYVSDDEKVDADALMKTLKESEPAENAERRRLGLDELYITGWAVKPHYDPVSHNLEWGLNIRSSEPGVPDVVNYTTRHLGRGGYVSSILVTSPETFDEDLAEFRGVDGKLSFNSGNHYSEFREGDKVAGYGIAALVAGGAGAAAVKSGAAKGFFAALLLALKGFGKALIVGIAALFLGAAKLIFGRKNREAEE